MVWLSIKGGQLTTHQVLHKFGEEVPRLMHPDFKGLISGLGLRGDNSASRPMTLLTTSLSLLKGLL